MIEIVKTMKDIEEEEWNMLAGDDKVETTYKWFCFIENVGIDPHPTFCHAVYRNETGAIQAIMPAYYHNINIRRFAGESLYIGLRQFFPNKKIPFMVTDVHIPLSCDFRFFGDRTYVTECLTALGQFTKEKKHFLLRIKDSNERLNLPGFINFEVYPEVYMNPYSSWDAYIQDQRGKRGKHLRYEYRKSVAIGTRTYMEEDLSGYSDLLYDMYINVCEKNMGTVIYPRNYFKKMEDYLHHYTKCLFAEENGDITAYLFLMENEYCISCKYAGRNYEARDPYVYFRLLYDLIKYSIEKKKPISAEKATYEAKLRRGFKTIEKTNYIKSYWPFIGDIYLKMLTLLYTERSKNIKKVKSLQV
jgi:predicted N-acyltransferase